GAAVAGDAGSAGGVDSQPVGPAGVGIGLAVAAAHGIATVDDRLDRLAVPLLIGGAAAVAGVVAPLVVPTLQALQTPAPGPGARIAGAPTGASGRAARAGRSAGARAHVRPGVDARAAGAGRAAHACA